MMDKVRLDICLATMGQQRCSQWWRARRGRITASRFGRVMSAQSENALARLHEDILKTEPSKYQSAACRMGIDEEDNAKRSVLQIQERSSGKNCVMWW